MTVTELLDRILVVYPGATPAGLQAFKPVFFARLKHREAKLEEAANEVFATFQPTARKPFPIPADFEAHLPSLKSVASGADGVPIRAQLEARAGRASKLYADWVAAQGRKIKHARRMSVYGACALEVMDRCRRAGERTQRVILSVDDIATCEMRALTSERAHRGPPAEKLSTEAWQAQIDQIRAEWANPPEAKAA